MSQSTTIVSPVLPLETFMAYTGSERTEYVNGEWIEKMPTTLVHSLVIKFLFTTLLRLETAGEGLVFADTTFILQEEQQWVRGSRIPDVMFYSTARAEKIRSSLNWQDYPITVVPDLVVEVLSPTDSYSDVVEKALAYLKDGVRLVWIVEPKTRRVTVMEQGRNTAIYLEHDEVLTGNPVLPAFELPLVDLFNR